MHTATSVRHEARPTLQQQLQALKDGSIMRGALLVAGTAGERRQRGGLHHGARVAL